MRFGKHPPKRDYRTLCFQNYLTSTLPRAPESYNILDRLKPGIEIDDFPIDGNDRYGDCTIAGIAHGVTVFRGLIGNRHVPTAANCIKTYFHLSGGFDSGLNMLDVCAYWQKHSFGGDKILAYTKLDRSKHDLVKLATYLFGGVYLGFQCQENVESDFEAKLPWTPGKLTQDGHAVWVIGYDNDGVEVLTWGDRQKATWAWWAECADEAYVIMPPEAKLSGFAPGFNYDQLHADLMQVARG